jgi:SagB-type dehydrogenase family enzyme
MNNRSIGIGYDYAHRMSYGMEEVFRAEEQGLEGSPDEPLKFKIYRDASKIPLSPDIPLTLGDTLEIFERRRAGLPANTEQKTFGLGELSCLLYYNLGLTRLERQHFYPLHRPVASARCFYPVELYVQVHRNTGAAQGLYHYDCAHHILETLRHGDWLHYVEQAVFSPIAEYDFVIFISVLFWKNAFKYRNFGYRLCSQEAGMLLENLLLTADALGLRSKVHYQFLDRQLNSLLGSEPGEESLFVMIGFSATGPGGAEKKEKPSPHEPAREPLTSLKLSYLKRSRLDSELCSALKQINEASYLDRLHDEFSLPLPAPERASANPFEGEVSLPELRGIKGVDLAEVLRERHSGASWLSPAPQAISLETLSESLRHLLLDYDNDLRGEDAAFIRCIDCYVVTNNVESLSPGVYRYCPQTHRMVVVRRRDCREELQQMSTQPNLNLSTAPAVFFLVGDYSSAFRQLGNRGYRILNMQAGLIAQRISVISAALGFFARCSDSFRVSEAENLLGISDSNATPLFQVILGVGELRPRYRYSLIF